MLSIIGSGIIKFLNLKIRVPKQICKNINKVNYDNFFILFLL